MSASSLNPEEEKRLDRLYERLSDLERTYRALQVKAREACAAANKTKREIARVQIAIMPLWEKKFAGTFPARRAA